MILGAPAPALGAGQAKGTRALRQEPSAVQTAIRNRQ